MVWSSRMVVDSLRFGNSSVSESSDDLFRVRKGLPSGKRKLFSPQIMIFGPDLGLTISFAAWL